MKKITRLLSIFLLLVLVANFVSCAKEEKEEKIEKTPKEITKLNIVTGDSDGNYYTVGQAFSTILKKQDIELKVDETNGSAENLDLILQDRADLGIAMLDVATEIYDRPQTSDSAIGTDLRVVMQLYPNVVQIITTEETGIKSFQDLKYKRVGVGLENSGVEWNARAIFGAYGMSYKDCEVAMVDPKEAVALMKAGKLDVTFISGTIPDSVIQELQKDSKQKIVFIPITGKERDELTKEFPTFKATTIPENSYGKNKEIDTVSVMNMLFVNKSVSDDKINKILETVGSKLTEFEAALGSADLISLENPEKITEIPLHQGAKRYFEGLK